MNHRPTAITLIAGLLLMPACSRRQYPEQTKETTRTITIVETLRDTVITVKPDTSILQALIECDSTGQAYLRQIDQLKSSNRINQSLKVKDNILTSTAAIDSFDIFLTYKNRYQTTDTNTVEMKTVTVTTNILKPWQKLLISVGILSILALITVLYIKLKTVRF